LRRLAGRTIHWRLHEHGRPATPGFFLVLRHLGRRCGGWPCPAGSVGQRGGQALSAALERVNALATTGKIGRKGLRELREHIELARRIGIMGQQVNRLASGRVRQNVERVDLTAILRETLLQHRRQIESLGFEVQQLLGPAQVMADPTLIFTLIETPAGMELRARALGHRFPHRTQ
jgi:hypothetical protein